MAQQGQVSAGIARIREGLDQRRAIAAWSSQPAFLALLAECYGLAGQPEQGLPLLEEGLGRAAASGERYREAELHRMQGELLQMCGAQGHEVEACFQQALAVASAVSRPTTPSEANGSPIACHRSSSSTARSL